MKLLATHLATLPRSTASRIRFVDLPLAQLVRLFLDDACSPHSGENTPGRDSQFELYLAARARRAACVVKRVDPPDFLITPLAGGACGLGQFGLAVKRAKSRSNIHKHISKGGKQLDRSMPGLIAIDISMLINEEGKLLAIPEGRGGIELVAAIVDQCVHELLPTLLRAANRTSTRGLVFFASVKTGRGSADFGVMPGSIQRWVAAPMDPYCADATMAFSQSLMGSSPRTEERWTFPTPGRSGPDLKPAQPTEPPPV